MAWCPLCDDYPMRPEWRLVYCPECDNYACDIHWYAAGCKCPICGQHEIPPESPPPQQHDEQER